MPVSLGLGDDWPGSGLGNDGDGLDDEGEDSGLVLAKADENDGALVLAGAEEGSGGDDKPGAGTAVTVTVLGSGAGAVVVTVTGGRTIPDGTWTIPDGTVVAAGADTFAPGSCLAASFTWNRATPPVAMATVMTMKQADSTPYRAVRQLGAVGHTPGYREGQADARFRGAGPEPYGRRFRACSTGSAQRILPGS